MITKEAIDLIKKFEGCRLKAYKCSAGVDTIGYGSTFYENGSKVKPGDTITQDSADKLLMIVLEDFLKGILKLLKVELNSNQIGAILSFVYNVGLGNFLKSTLLKKLNNNPKDITIKDEFMKWNKAAGKELTGLTNRRKAEAELYFKNI
jgi:lysozyme